jgi:hypothetical protein
LRDKARSIDIPSQLGPVTLVREIGSGGMGVVWLGRHELLCRDVAVKFLLANVDDPNDPNFVQFLAGARAASAVRHLGLTTIFDANVLDGLPYLVMQYVNGPTLAQIIAATGPMPAESAVSAMGTIAAAIAELHDHEIVHRDIKPGNVLIDLDGRAYVTDFGLTCLRRREAGLAAGTPAYMAPEMYDGLVSGRSDVFAMAVMLHEMLTGELPCRPAAADPRDLYRSVPSFERLRAIGTDAALIEIIERAMHKEPVFRFRTARQFARSLTDLPQADRPTTLILAPLVAQTLRGEGASGAPSGRPVAGSWHTSLAEMAARKRELLPPVATVPAPRSSPQAQAGRLSQSVPCVACGHDLRWQRREGNCPECGATIQRSLFEDRLIFADPKWLRKVAWRLRVLQWLLFGWVVIGPGSVWLVVMATSSGQTEDAAAASVTAFALVTLSILAVVIAVTAREPRSAGTTANMLRRLARGGAVWCVLVLISTPLERLWQFIPPEVLIVSFVAMFSLLAGYARHLRRRMSEAPGGATGIYGVAAALVVLALLLPHAANLVPGFEDGFTIVLGMLVLFGPILFALWLNRTRRALREAIRLHGDRDSLFTPASGA